MAICTQIGRLKKRNHLKNHLLQPLLCDTFAPAVMLGARADPYQLTFIRSLIQQTSKHLADAKPSAGNREYSSDPLPSGSLYLSGKTDK